MMNAPSGFHGEARRATLLLAIVLSSAVPASALDLSVEALFGNLNLPWASDVPIADSAYPSDLWLYGARVAVAESIGDGFRLETSYTTDPVLRHIFRSVIAYQAGFVKISAGPVLGAFNTPETPVKAGISVGLRLDLPGIVFVSARADSSMGAGLFAKGDYAQEFAELSAGWYVRNAICSGTITTRKFYRVPDAGELLADSSNRYAFAVDVYRKGSPYRVFMSLGYQDFSRVYQAGQIDTLGAVFLGVKLSAEVSTAVSIIGELESAVYAFGMDDLTARGPAQDSFLFRSSLGLIYRFGIERPATETEE